MGGPVLSTFFSCPIFLFDLVCRNRLQLFASRAGSFVLLPRAFIRARLAFRGAPIVTALPDAGAWSGVLRVAGIEVGAHTGRFVYGISRRLAVKCILAARDPTTVGFKPQEQWVRVHRARLHPRALF